MKNLILEVEHATQLSQSPSVSLIETEKHKGVNCSSADNVHLADIDNDKGNNVRVIVIGDENYEILRQLTDTLHLEISPLDAIILGAGPTSHSLTSREIVKNLNIEDAWNVGAGFYVKEDSTPWYHRERQRFGKKFEHRQRAKLNK